MSFFPASPGGNNQFKNISYSDWLNLSDAQKETGKWYVTDIPGADGTISIDLMTKLWENSDPTASFAAQNITDLPLIDYDLILYTTGDAGGINAVKERHIIEVSGSSASINYVFRRVFTPNVSTGVITVSDCVGFKIQDGTQSTFNGLNIPKTIYGIKLSKTLEIKAIAPDVSTSASKCMMSDGETSVEDRLDAHTFGGMVTITNYTSANRYQCPFDGYIRVNARADSTIYVYMASTSISSGVLMLGVTSAKEQNIIPCFVKKGVYVYCSDKSGNVDVIFEALS